MFTESPVAIPQEGSNGMQAQRTLQRVPDAKPDISRERDSGFARFLTGHVTLMAENGKLTIPYPLVAVIASLIVVIAMQTLAGVWWASSMTEKMQGLKDQTTEREMRSLETLKQYKSELDEQRIWIQTTRERLVKLELEEERERRRN